MSRLVLPAVLGLLLAAVPARAQEAWDQRYFNPAPADGDVLLPMPCGGQMAFREIGTPASPTDLLDDLAITLGQADRETAYSEYVRREHIVGSLSSSALGGYRNVYFFMGKYEVTQDQYDAVMGRQCGQPSVRGRLPATALSWFDAVAFTQRYTEWLLQNAADRLPIEGNRRAFLRLPSETEWEFAARGGSAVSEQAFRQRLFPMEGNISRYVWFQGSQSAAGQLHPVGLLAPNPLGLHDIIGNAEEIVLEPYQMNRLGRLHGQIGGFVTRGGSFRTPQDRLRSSMRTEYSYFDETTGQATRLDSFGFRLVVSAPINVSLERTGELRTAWQAAERMRTAESGTISPIEALDQLARNTSELETRAVLESIVAAFRNELAARNDIEGRALRGAIVAASVLIRSLRADHRLIAIVQMQVDQLERGEPTSPLLPQRRTQLQGMRERHNNTIRAYFDILTQVAEDYPAERRQEQLAIQSQAFRQSRLDDLVPFAELFTRQCLAYHMNRDINQQVLLEQILQ